MKDSNGEMKLGENIVPIDGKVPADLAEVNPKVNRAYHKKLPIM